MTHTIRTTYSFGGESLQPIEIRDGEIVKAAGTWAPTGLLDKIVRGKMAEAIERGHRVEILDGTGEYDARAYALFGLESVELETIIKQKGWFA